MMTRSERTRRRKKAKKSKVSEQTKVTRESKYFCGVCHGPYLEFTETEEQWIGCESCDTWYHFVCLGIIVAPDVFLCENCVESDN